MNGNTDDDETTSLADSPLLKMDNASTMIIWKYRKEHKREIGLKDVSLT